MSDYLTSPLESPLDDDMLTTPAMGSADMSMADIFTSPALMDMGGDFGDMPSLFGDVPGYEMYESKPPPRRQHPVPNVMTPNFDDLYTMSPDTPALDPSSMQSPRQRSTSVTRRKNQPTGTRKNVTPETLVPLDAPIQPRKYLTPSQTSRKELPATFARKRARSQAFGDEDELEDQAAPATLSEEDAIKAKRLQNTLAARRSRKRKLEYQRELEDALEEERKEKEMWKARSLVLEALLRDKGHDVPRMDDA
ncbi:hypothetical protein BV25DRAFT_1832120 [Artomyces pyxidatus]|uniref:Uncharacterized protein n=1 Tax=Artomyces pyxidatus TaxID=48021 RepID=A0ACB8SJ26_9AGAM|nr:hypothetical protein BV25DRAFT_1832120 [Artomyces pyxidatus]